MIDGFMQGCTFLGAACEYVEEGRKLTPSPLTEQHFIVPVPGQMFVVPSPPAIRSHSFSMCGIDTNRL